MIFMFISENNLLVCDEEILQLFSKPFQMWHNEPGNALIQKKRQHSIVFNIKGSIYNTLM